MNEELREAVAEGLSIWSYQGLANGPAMCAELCALWTNRLSAHNVTAEEFMIVAGQICDSAKFWPQLVDVLPLINELRRERRMKQIGSYALAIDPEGVEVLAPRSCIHQGYVSSNVPNDGIALDELPQALPTREEVRAGLTDGGRALLDEVSG